MEKAGPRACFLCIRQKIRTQTQKPAACLFGGGSHLQGTPLYGKMSRLVRTEGDRKTSNKTEDSRKEC